MGFLKLLFRSILLSVSVQGMQLQKEHQIFYLPFRIMATQVIKANKHNLHVTGSRAVENKDSASADD
jgi:hypothetical protein